MKIEAGKYYRTREGRKAFVEAVLGPSPFDGDTPSYPFYGWIDKRGAATWMRRGEFLVGGGDSDKDLVAEWDDPVSVTITANLVGLALGVGRRAIIVEPNKECPIYVMPLGRTAPLDTATITLTEPPLF
jgi:hypothetical protein